MNPTQRYALDYYDGGLVPIPLKLDGSKKPAIESWERYKTERPAREQVEQWFARPAGIGTILGLVSVGAECIDFDDAGPFEPIFNSLSSDLIKRLAIYETPKGGWHVVYRCEEIFTSVKLARRADKSTRIETRGDKSYIVAEGSPLEVHRSGIPYCHAWGCRLEALGTITPAERKWLWSMCMAFDQTGEPTPAEKLGRQLAEREYRKRHPVDAPSMNQARAYLAKMDPAIQGSNGSGACFRAACKLISFGLSEEAALQLLLDEYNPRCSPPWTERELDHKVKDAVRKVGV